MRAARCAIRVFLLIAVAAPSLPAQDVSGVVSNPPSDALAVAVEKLTPPQRIGQLMIVTAEGRTRPSTSDFAYLEQCSPGGVIIQQINSPGAAASYTARLRGLELRTGLPLWIGGNLHWLAQRERGAVSTFMQVPSMLALGAARDMAAVRDVAGVIAEHMRGMGFDLYLGPSLELAPELPGATGTIHCFGADPVFAGEAAAVFTGAAREAGVLAMPMGFPGGGANRKAGSAAVLLTPEALLGEQDLLPYRRAVESGVLLIHVGDTLVPTIDPLGRPACLSEQVIRGLIRERLGFQGVIVAGPMDSRQVTQVADAAEAAVLGFEAGADMLYFEQSGPMMLKAVRRIGDALQSGRLSQEALDGSLRRVIEAKRAHRQPTVAPIKERDAEKVASRRDFVELCYAAERKSVTLVKNEGGVLPLNKKTSGPLLVTGVAGVDELYELLKKQMKPLAQQRIATALHLGEVQDFEIKRITDRNRGVRTIVCLLSSSLLTEGQAKLVSELRATGGRVVVVLIGYPHGLPRFAQADAVLIAYCDPQHCDQSIRAVADVLFGDAPLGASVPPEPVRLRAGAASAFDAGAVLRCPSGRLPVAVSEAFPLGAGVSFDAAAVLSKAEWDFGNGKRVKGNAVSFAYDAPGRYTATLTATGARKESVTASFVVEVE